MNRSQLIQKLNSQLGTNFNWGRLCLLDLERLVISINQKFIIKPNIKEMNEDFKEELALEQEQLDRFDKKREKKGLEDE